MMAVEPSYRDQGLGFRMKLAHREVALERSLHSICWTYDPLQSRNATLNVAKLAAHPMEYIPDCYGQFSSAIEKSLPSDRFAVEWRIWSAKVARHLLQARQSENELSPRELETIASLPRANHTGEAGGGFIENRTMNLKIDAPQLLVEIPSNTDLMRKRNLTLAERWRMETRKIFTRYLQSYRIAAFVPPAEETGGRCFYVLKVARAHAAGYTH
jgi:predicted GNAT superfamily acetyltransferase